MPADVVFSAVAAVLAAWLLGRSLPRGENRRFWIAAILALALVSMGVRLLVPVMALWQSPHDDLALVTQAYGLLHGNWLGDWTPFTLIKGPGYAFVLVAARELQVSPIIFVQAALVLSAAYLVSALRGIVGRTWLLVVIFGAVVLNPAYVGDAASRVYRDGIIGPAVLVLIALAVVIARASAHGTVTMPARFALAPLCFGGTAAFLALTKSDALTWAFLPAVGAAIATCAIASRKVTWGRFGKRLGISLAIGVATFACIWGAVATVNASRYGYFGAEDLKSGGAKNLWSSLTAIDGGSKRTFVSISKNQRAAAYRVSPTLQRMAPTLEAANGWKLLSCQSLAVCDESTTWQEMELRDAAVAAGGTSEQAFQKVMGDAASEVQDACAAKRLRCNGGSPIVGVGNLHDLRYRAWLTSAMQLVGQDLRFVSASASPRTGEAIPPDLDARVADIWRSTVLGVDGGTLSMFQGLISPESRTEVVRYVARAYSVFVSVGLLMTVVAAVGALCLRRQTRRIWSAIGASIAFASGVAVNVAIVAFLDANMGYLGQGAALYLLPSTPLLILSAGMGYAAVCATGSRFLVGRDR